MKTRSTIFLFLFFCSGAWVQAQIYLRALLDRSQEVPATTSTGIGIGSFSVSDDMTQLHYRVTVNGLTGAITAAHFHNAAPGLSGGVVKPITFTGNTAEGVWSRTDAQPFTVDMLAELILGNLYVNVHTAQFPGGEIRGQVELTSHIDFTASLDGTQEVPATGSSASGTMSITLYSDLSMLQYTVNFTGLSGAATGAHFHKAPEGQNGAIVNPISLAFGNVALEAWTDIDNVPLTAGIVKDMILGNMYVNVHTASFPGGEIRGQIRMNSGTGLWAFLEQSQEVDTTAEIGSATAAIWLSADRSEVHYAITACDLTGPITGAHFHNAASGTNGGVVKPLTFSNGSAIGVWKKSDPANPLTDSLLTELLLDRLYLNIHTSKHPGGEIRGQVLLMTGIGFTAGLDGRQEIPSNASTAKGTGAFFLDEYRENLDYDIVIDGVSTAVTGSHFHHAPAGVSGPVVRTIEFMAGSPYAFGQWTDTDSEPLTAALVKELLKGNIYANVHSSQFPGGEIRGQLLSNPSGLSAVEAVPGVLPSVITLDQNYPNPFGSGRVGNQSTRIAFSLPTAEFVTLDVFNALGARVHRLVGERLEAGRYSATLDSGDLPSGVYLYRLSSGGNAHQTRTMSILR